jgi:hypothetical protein
MLIFYRESIPIANWGHHGHDRMVVGFMNICAISAYHLKTIQVANHCVLISCLVSNWVRVRVLVFKATFDNISVIPWGSILLMEETGENQ